MLTLGDVSWTLYTKWHQGVIHVIYVDDIPVRYTFLFMCFAFYPQGSASTLWRDSCAAPEEVNKTRYPRESSPLFFCHTGKGRSAGGLNRQRTAFSVRILATWSTAAGIKDVSHLELDFVWQNWQNLPNLCLTRSRACRVVVVAMEPRDKKQVSLVA